MNSHITYIILLIVVLYRLLFSDLHADIYYSKMKVIKITFNGFNTLILAISSNYKLIHKINNQKKKPNHNMISKAIY